MGLDRTQIQIRTILLVVGIQTAAVASTCRAGIQGIIATLLPVVLTCADRSTLDFSHYLVAIVVAMCFLLPGVTGVRSSIRNISMCRGCLGTAVSAFVVFQGFQGFYEKFKVSVAFERFVFSWVLP